MHDSAQEGERDMTQNPAVSEPVERRTIEHVPVDERHGRARDLFTVWFGSNIMLLTIITGALATTVFALPLWAGALAIVLGNVIGGIVMALHAAQGPQMGVPQMLQTRAQFGSYGSLLVVVLVIFMYLGFFASNAVLGGQALAKVTGMPTNWAITIIGLISVVATIIGYRLIHRVTAALSVVAGGALLVAFFWMVGRQRCPRGDMAWRWLHLGRLHGLAVRRRTVADRLRAVRIGLHAVHAEGHGPPGRILGHLHRLPARIRAADAARRPGGRGAADERNPGRAIELTRGVSTGVFAIFALGITATNAMNLYCGALSTITVGQSLFPRWRPAAMSRAATAVVLFVIAIIPALVSADDFLANYANFLALLLCVLIPWTAVNLVDYYLLRHGVYDIDALFERDGGRYGKFNWVGHRVLLHRHRGADPVPVDDALHRGGCQSARRRGYLVDRRARSHLSAVLRADAVEDVGCRTRRSRVCPTTPRPRRDAERLRHRRGRDRRMHRGVPALGRPRRHGHRRRSRPVRRARATRP